MLAVANYLAEDRPDDLQRTILGATTALTLVGATCVIAAMNERFRPTFYKHETMAMYVCVRWLARHVEVYIILM